MTGEKSMNGSAILFLNGDKPAALPDTAGRFVVCADGAYAYARPCNPDVVLGDFDSFNLTDVPAGVEIVRHPVQKNYTDGHLAVEFLHERGVRDVQIYGATGGARPDHELCNYSLLAYARELGMTAELVADAVTVRFLRDEVFTGSAPEDTLVSVVPFSDIIHILYTKGLKYRAECLTVDKVHIVSVSNAALGGEFSVSVTGSALLFVGR